MTAKLTHQQQVYKRRVEAKQSCNELQHHCALKRDTAQSMYSVGGINLQGSPFTISINRTECLYLGNWDNRPKKSIHYGW